MGEHGSIEIIIPVKNMAEHIRACLPPLLAQMTDGDKLTVVDDGSSDDTVKVATGLGAIVLRNSLGGGPYAARHSAANVSRAQNLLFIDARCRALPGLLDSHREQLADPEVALSSTRMNIAAGKGLAAAVAKKLDPFRYETHFEVEGKRDFFPTANLGIKTAAYRGVGGFRNMRSGGDADLCWRVQAAGLGRITFDGTVLLDWIPRDSLSGLFEQWHRYGQSSVLLESLHPSPASSAQTAAPRSRARELVRRYGAGSTREPLVTAMSGVLHIAYVAGRFRARHVGDLPQVELFAQSDPEC